MNYGALIPLNFGIFAELLVMQYIKLPFEYSRPVIFANLLRLLNSRNEGHMEISGFTVLDGFAPNLLHWYILGQEMNAPGAQFTKNPRNFLSTS